MWIISFNLCDGACDPLSGMKDLDAANTAGNPISGVLWGLAQLKITALHMVTPPSRGSLDPVTDQQRGITALSFGFNSG